MKRILIALLILAASTLIFCGCQKKQLPVPEYPLNTEVIEETAINCGFSVIIEEDNWVKEERQGQTLFNLSSTVNNQFAAGISSGYKDGERILFISFPRSYIANTIPIEDCEDAVIFATSLFGGFDSTHQVYNMFQDEYDTINSEQFQHEGADDSQTSDRGGSSYWERTIGDTTCRIVLEQPEPGESQQFLSVIVFASDWDTFMKED